MTIRLLLVDDHAVVRSGLHMILEPEEDLKIIGEAENAADAIEFVIREKPDVVLMDIGLPDMTGIEATKVIKEKQPNTAIVALTIHEDEEYFFKMLEAGANGYVPKRAAPEELLTAIRAAAANEVFIYPSLAKLLVKDFLAQPQDRSRDKMDILTKRENEVLAHLADGASNQEIADTLHISPKTVARHRENIMRKLNLRNRTELVKYAIRKGIIQA
jgi:two-component system response regulator NreC